MAKKRNLKTALIMAVFLVVLLGTVGVAQAGIVVDDFDSYGPDPALRNVWKDSITGTIVKNRAEIFIASDPNRTGQSMEFYYRNFEMSGPDPVGCTAEANTVDLAVGTNWTASGAEALVLYFYGDPANGQDAHGNYTILNDRMWVSLLDGDSNEGIVRYDTAHGYDINDVKEAEWHEWNIDLADPCLADVNLANVAKMYIGFGGLKGGATSKYGAGYSGGGDTVWFDDIILRRLLPTIFVDADATGGNDGTSWANAYKYLQDALADANSNPDVNEIWVAEGTYKPDANSANPSGTNDRTATFQLINGVAIYGGYAGYWAAEPNERDIEVYETILSGDINTPGSSDNSHHVVTGSGTDANAVLDGFTITAGNANGGAPDNYGGGMYNNTGSPIVTNCTFSGNSATVGAGGMLNYPNSSPTVTNCTFSGNSAVNAGGGGMWNESSSSPKVTNCTFSGNSAGDSAGGMGNNNSNPNLTNCTFSGNSAGNDGGGMYSYNNSDPNLTNCTFTGNSADWGGGMYNNTGSPIVTNCTFKQNLSSGYGGGMCNDTSSPTVTNCTFSGNSATVGAGGMLNYPNSSPTVTNCTFSGNSAVNAGGGGMWNESSSSPKVTNCTFSGNSAGDSAGGMGNNNSDPNLTNCTFSGNSAEGNGGGMRNYNNSDPTLTNCILWGNTAPSGPQIYNDGTSSATVSYSDVQGGWGGTENINEDPVFIDSNGLDGIADTADDEEYIVHLRGYSPCINAGDPGGSYGGQVDIDKQPRVAYGRVDMGADEVFPIAGDYEPDGDVDLVDFGIFANNWLAGM